LHRVAVLAVEADLDHIAEHTGGELRQPDPPDPGILLLEPEVRGRVEPIAEQACSEQQLAVVEFVRAGHRQGRIVPTAAISSGHVRLC
jgi:hypothetical protein